MIESFIFSEITRIPNWQTESVDYIVYHLNEFNSWLSEPMIRRTMQLYDKMLVANKKVTDAITE